MAHYAGTARHCGDRITSFTTKDGEYIDPGAPAQTPSN
jgi:hypothetical protein